MAFWQPLYYKARDHGFMVGSQYLEPNYLKLVKMSGRTIERRLKSSRGLARAGVPVRRITLFLELRYGIRISDRLLLVFFR